MRYIKRMIFCYLLCIPHSSPSQVIPITTIKKDSLAIFKNDSLTSFHVAGINVSGNRKTKAYIILREIPFKAGDTLKSQALATTLEQARRQVYNLNLFSEVAFSYIVISSGEISVNIIVREKWYIYPTPQFQLADRNFNEWLKTYHADFNRVVYGVKFIHYNFSGRGDQLRVYLLNGYASNISVSYSTPSSNPALTEGFRISAGYTQNREIDYKTNFNNKLLQYKQTDFVRRNFGLGVGYQLRKGFFKRTLFSISYTYINVSDSVITEKYNPDYLNSRKAYKGFPEFSYTYQYTNLDNVNYPLSGKAYRYSFTKRGLGIKGGVNMLLLDGAFSKYFSHFKNSFFSSVQVIAKLKAPFVQPYINQRALGYGDIYLRGLEYYVIDGVASAVAKYTIKKKLVSFNISLPFKIRAVPRIPFSIFAKAYADAGYSYNKKEFDTRLNNRFLYSGGFGIDILSLYDININLEYSFNQLGENGLFLHTKGGF